MTASGARDSQRLLGRAGGVTRRLEVSCHHAEKASLLVKARRLAVAAHRNTVAPSCLQVRVARGQPLPWVALVPLMNGQTEGEEEEDRKLRTTLAFLCGVRREGMPRDVFRVVMDLLMPSWDPLRRKNTGTWMLEWRREGGREGGRRRGIR